MHCCVCLLLLLVLAADGLDVWDDGGVATVVFERGSPTSHLAFAPVDEKRSTGAKLFGFVQPEGRPTALQQQVSKAVSSACERSVCSSGVAAYATEEQLQRL
jgi:hypothetical protein